MASAETLTADPLNSGDFNMEVIIWKFVLKCTNTFLSTCSLFSITLNIFGNENGFDT